jgi:hypothetical protein
LLGGEVLKLVSELLYAVPYNGKIACHFEPHQLRRNRDTPANAAAAITALINFNITAPRSLTTYANLAVAVRTNTLATIGGNGCSRSVTPVPISSFAVEP